MEQAEIELEKERKMQNDRMQDIDSLIADEVTEIKKKKKKG